MTDKLNLIRVCKQLHKTISESTLYKELVFKNEVQFADAEHDKSISQQVRHLCLGNMEEYDEQLVAKLPTMLTRLQFLKIQGGRMTNQQNFTVMADNWNSLEKIVESGFGGPPMTVILLIPWTFPQLTSVDLSLSRSKSEIERYAMTVLLTQLIKNIPSLENLTVTNSVVTIVNVEDIHVTATKLKHLKFGDVHLCTEAAINPASYHPSQSLECFSLMDITVIANIIDRMAGAADDRATANAIREWIKYIGNKYPQLQALELTLSEQITGGKKIITATLITALRNLTHLKCYSVMGISSSKQPILDIMAENEVQLKRFEFFVDEDDGIEEIFSFIQTAPPISATSSLALSIFS